MERERELLRMHASGESNTREMALRLNVTQRTIYNQLDRLGLGTSHLPRKYRAPRKQEFSESEKLKIVSLFDEGKYITEIAVALGRTLVPVRRAFSDLGLTTSNMKSIKVGRRFGYLTVISQASPQKTYKGHFESRSLVRCHCGCEKEVFNYNLRSGNTKTCGCKIHLSKPETPYIRILHGYLGGAKIRGLDFGLSVAQVERIVSMNCFYCGSPPSNNLTGRKGGRSTATTILAYTGVDRVDSRVGYQPGNVLPSCSMCNRAKSDMELREFIAWLNRLGKVTDEKAILRSATDLGDHLKSLDSAPLFRELPV